MASGGLRENLIHMILALFLSWITLQCTAKYPLYNSINGNACKETSTPHQWWVMTVQQSEFLWFLNVENFPPCLLSNLQISIKFIRNLSDDWHLLWSFHHFSLYFAGTTTEKTPVCIRLVKKEVHMGEVMRHVLQWSFKGRNKSDVKESLVYIKRATPNRFLQRTNGSIMCSSRLFDRISSRRNVECENWHIYQFDCWTQNPSFDLFWSFWSLLTDWLTGCGIMWIGTLPWNSEEKLA